MDLIGLVQSCSPGVQPTTIAALIRQESGGNQYAVNLNSREFRINRVPRSRTEAVHVLSLLKTNRFGSYDIGLAQINSMHLARFGLSPEALLEPCTNIRAAVQILGECYARTDLTLGDQTRLARAFSCYNTGNQSAGFRNGYVAGVYRHARASSSTQSNPTVITHVATPAPRQRDFSEQGHRRDLR